MVFSLVISRRRILGLGSWVVTLGLGPLGVQARQRLRLNGWLRVEKLEGRVIYRRLERSAPLKAWLGQRLSQVGEILETAADGTALLVLDSGLGTLTVAQNTKLTIKALHTNREGGRITRIEVLRGQVRLKVRPLTNPSSRLELQTPVGITGVRGTEFGLAVQPSGQTGVATLSGRVDAAALGTTVTVDEARQTVILPGLPPQSPQPLRDDPDLKMSLAEGSAGRVRLVGVTDPANLLLVDGEPYNTGPGGDFEIVYHSRGQAVMTLRSITPLGTQRKYEIPLF
jgi:hypothetical protein